MPIRARKIRAFGVLALGAGRGPPGERDDIGKYTATAEEGIDFDHPQILRCSRTKEQS